MIIDIDKAVRSFLEQAERFKHLVLLTDDEALELYGVGVAVALARMERIDQEGHLCADCGGFCCWKLGCELYDTEFNGCPISDIRPLTCRLYFCNHFYVHDDQLVLGLADTFFACFFALEKIYGDKAKAINIPPFGRVYPEFAEILSKKVDDMRQGRLAPEFAAELIRQEAERYRISFGNNSRVS